MKIFISADIEGIAGVVAPEQCRSGNVEYEKARALMEQEVNAAIAGAFDGGATQVVVADSHGPMINLRAANMDARASLVQGKPRPLSMIEGIAEHAFDGVFLIGYHSGAGESGILAHTINGACFYRVSVNGKVMAEADLYTAAAAECGAPLLLVSGDDKLQHWIEQRYSSCHYACVKRMISTTAAESLSPDAAIKTIRSAAQAALQTLPVAPAPCIHAPYELQLETMRPVMADVFALIPGVRQTGPRTVTYRCESMHELIRLLCAFSYLGSTQL